MTDRRSDDSAHDTNYGFPPSPLEAVGEYACSQAKFKLMSRSLDLVPAKMASGAGLPVEAKSRRTRLIALHT